MVVTYELDPNPRYARPINASVIVDRDWCVRRAKDQAPAAIQSHRELAGAVALERVGKAGHQLADMSSGGQVGQAGKELSCTRLA